jgi:endo-alpha-1,4-polygalactosaminidase (GH114 family)
MSPSMRNPLYALSFLSSLSTALGSACAAPAAEPSTPAASAGATWRPLAGATWQIVLDNPLDSTSFDASVYDIDMFDNTASTIDSLHSLGRKVICYFSAGSYENWRSDASEFTKSDYGSGLDGWPGEYWLDTNSDNVRRIMTARLQLAQSKGCDGVDPDNVDAYNNDNGLGLTTADAIDYVTFLANGAAALNMSVGLKNAEEIIGDVLPLMQWSVNEQCEVYTECDQFQPFIAAGKPVFHIEYPDSAPDVTAAQKAKICGDKTAAGFSTVLKDMDLSKWIDAC